jgi:hypothetical protein
MLSARSVSQPGPRVWELGEDSRIWKGDPLVVGEVRSIVLPLAARHSTANLADYVGGPFVGALHVFHARPPVFTLDLGADRCSHGPQRVLAGIQLVRVETHPVFMDPTSWKPSDQTTPRETEHVRHDYTKPVGGVSRFREPFLWSRGTDVLLINAPV